jgi:hypothetical protein
MQTSQDIDWSDVEAAAKRLAGNWQAFNSFAWMSETSGRWIRIENPSI